MNIAAILQKVHHLRIKTRRLLSAQRVGVYATKRLGNGFEFDRLRDYQAGDNVRAIDWNCSARSNKLIVRSYREDTCRRIILLVDVSASTMFGSGDMLKKSVIQEIAVILSFSAQMTNDLVGAVLFSNRVEQIIPARSGKQHVMRLVETLMEAPEQNYYAPTEISSAYAACLSQFQHGAIVVVISDFLSADYQKLLPVLRKQHEVMAIRVHDSVERVFPEGILVHMEDPESQVMLNSTNPLEMQSLQGFLAGWIRDQNMIFQRYGIDYLDLKTDSSYDDALLHFFNKH